MRSSGWSQIGVLYWCCRYERIDVPLGKIGLIIREPHEKMGTCHNFLINLPRCLMRGPFEFVLGVWFSLRNKPIIIARAIIFDFPAINIIARAIIYEPKNFSIINDCARNHFSTIFLLCRNMIAGATINYWGQEMIAYAIIFCPLFLWENFKGTRMIALAIISCPFFYDLVFGDKKWLREQSFLVPFFFQKIFLGLWATVFEMHIDFPHRIQNPSRITVDWHLKNMIQTAQTTSGHGDPLIPLLGK